jgi:glycosyltransferase involved in cell wall biosynthesis
MRNIAPLVDELHIALPIHPTPVPEGTAPLDVGNIHVMPLSYPSGRNFTRKLAMIPWVVKNIGRLQKHIRQADAVHALVPGDVGTIGLVLAYLNKKPLFVRHCGTWGYDDTLAAKFLDWLLPRIAGGRVVVMATGGGEAPPEPSNPSIEWIFSTSLYEHELAGLAQADPWQPGETLDLISVGRLSRAKNVHATIAALLAIKRAYPDVRLHVLGEGAYRPTLEAEVQRLGLGETVIFHGNVPHDEVLQRLSTADIFVFPTQTAEGFPKALLEAMASGLPCIAAPVSVIPYLLRDGTGIVLENTAPQAITTAVLDLIRDPDTMAAMGRKAREESLRYSLENWRELIRKRLEKAWRQPLRSDEPW